MEVGKNDLYLDPSYQASLVEFAGAKTATKEAAEAGSFSNVEGEIDTAVVNFSGVSDLVNLASNSPGSTARKDRVESLKAMIANGEYNVDAYSIAGDPSLIKAILG
ncbi:MAG: flagellar biosynthesis anti-sigma factor FlgM [Candidatus Caenarcaniphilales bacterium]|nr:flagellar biosynthesis anti-sigma factor FlgM [Candidatus Caenarcaniphilales bacterium]